MLVVALGCCLLPHTQQWWEFLMKVKCWLSLWYVSDAPSVTTCHFKAYVKLIYPGRHIVLRLWQRKNVGHRCRPSLIFTLILHIWRCLLSFLFSFQSNTALMGTYMNYTKSHLFVKQILFIHWICHFLIIFVVVLLFVTISIVSLTRTHNCLGY